MSFSPKTTRERLIFAAALLFRQNGFHGTGLSEILKATDLPKGSLYHHFPNGKADLAKAAADWVSQGMLGVIDASFQGAASFQDGATTLCHKLAKLFDTAVDWQGCPISSVLFDGPDNEEFRIHADGIFTAWNGCVASHAVRFGMTESQAANAAERLMMTIEGSWTLARARRSSDVIRRVPGHLFD